MSFGEVSRLVLDLLDSGSSVHLKPVKPSELLVLALKSLAVGKSATLRLRGNRLTVSRSSNELRASTVIDGLIRIIVHTSPITGEVYLQSDRNIMIYKSKQRKTTQRAKRALNGTK